MLRIFALIFFITSLFSFNSYASSSEIYSVRGVIANAIDEDPSKSRQVAISDARRRAFKILLKNLDFKVSANELFSDEEIAETIRSQQVDAEKIAGNEYSAILNIMFDQDFIDQAILQKKLHHYKANGEIESYVIFPAQIENEQLYLWNKENKWRIAISGNLKTKTNKKFLIPEASIDNITSINENKIIASNYNDISNITEKYNTDSAYILIFSYDENKSKAYVDITYLQNAHIKKYRLSFINAQSLDQENLLDIVASKTIEYLSQQDHKIKDSNDPNKYIGIPITNMGEWLMLRNKINNADFIEKSQTKLISNDLAIFAISYKKDESTIESDFRSIGISLNKKAKNYFLGTISNMTPNQRIEEPSNTNYIKEEENADQR